MLLRSYTSGISVNMISLNLMTLGEGKVGVSRTIYTTVSILYIPPTWRRNPSPPLHSQPHPSRWEGVLAVIQIFRTPMVTTPTRARRIQLAVSSRQLAGAFFFVSTYYKALNIPTPPSTLPLGGNRTGPGLCIFLHLHIRTFAYLHIQNIILPLSLVFAGYRRRLWR
jgi:hypothetical protein